MEKAKKTSPASKKLLVAVLAAVVLGIGIGYALRGGDRGPETAGLRENASIGLVQAADHMHDEAAPSGGQIENAVYICPMNCVPPMEKPGDCPVCGMQLVAMTDHGTESPTAPPAIRLTAENIRRAGIQTAPVQRKFVTKEIRLFGKIEYDPVEQYRVTAFAPGIIDRIYVKRAGQTVRAGDPLFDMHSSELFVLEQDLFEVLKHFPDPVDYRPAKGQIYKRQMRPPRRHFSLPRPGEASEEEIEVKRAALEKLGQIRRKMMLLGLTNEDIERVIARGLPSGISTVITPTTGIVQEQYAFKGAYVNTGETIFTIANPQYIWARLDGYAADFPWIRLGQEAEFEVDAYPGEVFRGKVIYLDPEFDPETRTFKIGVLHIDPDRRLRPNMLVRCVIQARMTADGVAPAGSGEGPRPPLVIPDTAPLITGNRAVVYLEAEGRPGAFEGRDIVLGPRARGYYVVEKGLKEGEKVVVNGNFKLDSAVQILARPSMMEPHQGMATGDHARHSADGAMAMEHEQSRTSLVQPGDAGAMRMAPGKTDAPQMKHAATPPMQMKNTDKKPPPADKKVGIGEARRRRFSELLKNRSMKTQGRMRTRRSQTSAPGRQRAAGEEMGMEEMMEAAEHGAAHRHGVAGMAAEMEPGGEPLEEALGDHDHEGPEGD